MKSGAEILLSDLERLSLKYIFGVPGGATLPIYGALPKFPNIKHILFRHEQGATHAADGFSRSSNSLGVCMATSGPGALNLVTGLATAMMDSVPLLAITGQVGSKVIGTDAFQETDITGASMPACKHNYLVNSVEQLIGIVPEAAHIATTGRRGPVLIDIPKDILESKVDYTPRSSNGQNLPGYRPAYNPEFKDIEKAIKLIEEAKQPVILAGRGVIQANAKVQLQQFAEKTDIPVICTLLGMSNMPADHPLFFGFPGMHGMAYASLLLHASDLIINIGGRFDDRIVGDKTRFAPNSKKIHIDIDASEFNKMLKVDVAVHCDAKPALELLTENIKPLKHSDWISAAYELKENHPLFKREDTSILKGRHLISAVSDVAGGDIVLCTGVGQHQMWVAQYFQFSHKTDWLSSGGLGTMGFEVPSAIGAQFANPNRTVVSICGDGGFQMTLMELATIKENSLPVKLFIMNNNHLGMITQWQDMFYSRTFVAESYTGNPDFVKLGESYGIKAIRIKKHAELYSKVEEALQHNGPVLVDCVIEKVDNVFPMIPAGKSVHELLEED